MNRRWPAERFPILFNTLAWPENASPPPPVINDVTPSESLNASAPPQQALTADGIRPARQSTLPIQEVRHHGRPRSVASACHTLSDLPAWPSEKVGDPGTVQKRVSRLEKGDTEEHRHEKNRGM